MSKERYVSADTQAFFKYGNARDIVRLLKDAGFTAYDAGLFTNGAFAWMLFAEDWQEQAQSFRAYTDELDIVCNQSHAPFPSMKDNDPAYNEETFPLLVRAIEVSGILGAKVCVVHPCNDWDKEKNVSLLYKRLEPYARKAGVKIGVENMYNCIGWRTPEFKALKAACSHHDDFKAYMDALPEDAFVACVDIGHAEMSGLGTSAVDMIKTLGNRMGAMHLHDTDRIHDNHQVPFTHDIDFSRVIAALREIGYKGDITLETVYAPQKAPKELQEPIARYLAAIANYFKEQIDK